MILPNKLITFHDSILIKIIYNIEVIENKDMNVYELYEIVQNNFVDLNEYILALDVLYVLERIEYDERLGDIKYVKKH